MNSSNPLQMLMMMGQKQNSNPLQQMMGMGTPQRQPINPQQLTAAVPKMDKQTLANLVQQARRQGISEQDIEAGLNFLLQLK